MFESEDKENENSNIPSPPPVPMPPAASPGGTEKGIGNILGDIHKGIGLKKASERKLKEPSKAQPKQAIDAEALASALLRVVKVNTVEDKSGNDLDDPGNGWEGNVPSAPPNTPVAQVAKVELVKETDEEKLARLETLYRKTQTEIEKITQEIAGIIVPPLNSVQQNQKALYEKNAANKTPWRDPRKAVQDLGFLEQSKAEKSSAVEELKKEIEALREKLSPPAVQKVVVADEDPYQKDQVYANLKAEMLKREEAVALKKLNLQKRSVTSDEDEYEEEMAPLLKKLEQTQTLLQARIAVLSQAGSAKKAQPKVFVSKQTEGGGGDVFAAIRAKRKSALPTSDSGKAENSGEHQPKFVQPTAAPLVAAADDKMVRAASTDIPAPPPPPGSAPNADETPRPRSNSVKDRAAFFASAAASDDTAAAQRRSRVEEAQQGAAGRVSTLRGSLNSASATAARDAARTAVASTKAARESTRVSRAASMVPAKASASQPAPIQSTSASASVPAPEGSEPFPALSEDKRKTLYAPVAPSAAVVRPMDLDAAVTRGLSNAAKGSGARDTLYNPAGQAKSSQIHDKDSKKADEDVEIDQLLEKLTMKAGDSVSFSGSASKPRESNAAEINKRKEALKGLGEFLEGYAKKREADTKHKKNMQKAHRFFGGVDREQKVINVKELKEKIQEARNAPFGKEEDFMKPFIAALKQDHELNSKSRYGAKQGELSTGILKFLETVKPGFRESKDNPWHNPKKDKKNKT